MSWVLLASGSALATFGVVWTLVVGDEPSAFGCCAVGCWLLSLYAVIDRYPITAALYGLLAGYWTWQWWKHRRNGRWKRAVRQLGAKSKARVQALVRRMTPSPIPSPAGGRA